MLRPDAPEEGWALPESIRARAHAPNNPLQLRAQSLGLTLIQRDHIPNSRRAHECTEFARSQGKLAAFHASVLERYWSRGEDLHEWSVLRGAAVDSGLDADQMQREVEAGQWRAPMEAGISAAHEIGLDGVPTFLVGNKFLIQGAQSGEVFRQAFARLGHPAP